ncbi:hypothetical protein [Aestuariirhabdus litorea]|uniref:Uncharacterized protein n=1 Tax=Aestuariirhabdus litorea TaxID=2528527 RepID=A0A3P3VM71_9GAMM|nr:hypothetical protein [Aestuariirhabdus litorea]RRJ82819.1 hypothetical protein D0544_13290 [Aestuariirhabdus litorea]RWW92978.1 hypothetical protein DZC74_13265 [Endozoicomonadaceae bacterium GTF-13]
MNRHPVYLFVRDELAEHPELNALSGCSGWIGDPPLNSKLAEQAALAACCGEIEPDFKGYRVVDADCGLPARSEIQPLIVRVEIRRPAPNFSLNRSQHGSGFLFYAPDPASLTGYRINGLEVGLRQWLSELDCERVAGVWLDCPEAEAEKRGLELDALVLAREVFDGLLWLSGGAWETRHIDNLLREGNCDALVLEADRFLALGGVELVRKLNPPEQIPLAVVDDTVAGSCQREAG